ncbi:MAG: hypothetical protein A3F31_05055 [Candidatus Levybacteria bacterium RIFCSPHIGHO2_12_FULL_38_12]|nr:MAG: hypothetical protein A3D75_00850 [Candidatus Levybacteria bacterium RIFCSPHIGHO2_02_FULL_37_18]OGH22648.1 MAG: hypothetical protein A3F31_05055 [Candidatus Levybacteria bacterium RIFCSPHIGHO2_12_FULL_38_12]OGH33472.1 MAG: hypothetical protein A3A47_03800 [Candidatus Levybacteria bacterium RIFCSPLOWO2_01_FULL_37_20]OGH43753.1 MAG: hypothetical protein A3J14_04350 [Candidatus Levybacteria bacterium RIFCSPLOWO2_02_FULL_37_18]OGH52622.1 MAG: hypothetical protein A3G13_02050 [Candidatus Levy
MYGKQVLVTGGAGFIGSNLVRALLAKNNSVLVVDNFSVGSINNLKDVKANKNLKVINADILHKRTMESLTKGIDVIFHLAVVCLRVSFKDPFLVNEVNSTGTLSMLWAAHKANVKKFVYCSSSEVYGTAVTAPMSEMHPLRPTTIYGASKLQGEIYTKCFNDNFGLPTVIVRPFNTYGYHEHVSGPYGEVIPRFVIRIKNNLSPIIFGDGKQTRDFTFVTDTVVGMIMAAENDRLNGDVVNIARGHEVTINDVAKTIIKQLNNEVKITYVSPRPSDVRRHFADITKAKKILNFMPKISIEEGLEMYLAYLENEKIDFKTALKPVPERNW